MDAEPADDYPTSVAVTWRLSFDRLASQSPAAARLLELCAFFAPDPISLTLLQQRRDDQVADPAMTGSCGPRGPCSGC